MRAFLSIVACLALVPACSDGPAGPDSPPGVGALVVTGGIAIANDDGPDRYYVLFEEETAALVDLNFNPEAEERAIPVGGGIQWVAEGFVSWTVEL